MLRRRCPNITSWEQTGTFWNIFNLKDYAPEYQFSLWLFSRGSDSIFTQMSDHLLILLSVFKILLHPSNLSFIFRLLSFSAVFFYSCRISSSRHPSRESSKSKIYNIMKIKYSLLDLCQTIQTRKEYSWQSDRWWRSKQSAEIFLLVSVLSCVACCQYFF